MTLRQRCFSSLRSPSLRRALCLSGVFVLVAAGPTLGQGAGGQTPAERGRALIERLGRGPLKGLVDEVGGEHELSGRLVPGSGRTFVLQTKTQRVSRDGVEIYRIRDRLRVDLGGLGTARLRVEGDLRLDLSPERLLLVSEEPRGRGLVMETRIELRREGQGWVRVVSQGQSAPKVTPVERPSLVLTPPLGVGLRLASAIPGELGYRASLPAMDLETGLATRWRASVDDELKLELKPESDETPQGGPGAGLPAATTRVQGAVLTWREGGASFVAWRPAAAATPLLRLALRGEGARLEVRAERLVHVLPTQEGPSAATATFLRALARRDEAALEALLDFPALLRGAKAGSKQGAATSAAEAERFRRVLLQRLTQESWLEERGLRLGFASALPGALRHEALGSDQAQVSLKAAPHLRFRLQRSGKAWRITALPLLEPAEPKAPRKE